MIGILMTSEVKANVYQFNFKSIDGKEINSGTRGKITQRLQSIYEDVITGKSEKYNSWLSYADSSKES